MDETDWVIPGSEGSSEIGGLSVEVIRMITDAMPSSGEGARDGTFGLCRVTAVVVEILLGTGGLTLKVPSAEFHCLKLL